MTQSEIVRVEALAQIFRESQKLPNTDEERMKSEFDKNYQQILTWILPGDTRTIIIPDIPE